MEDFKIVSPNPEERTKKLKDLINFYGPASPDFSELLILAGERELNENEINMILAEKINGVAGFQAHILKAFQLNQATVKDIAPSSKAYFEYLCGPLDSEKGPEEYIVNVLPEYRKILLKRDLIKGLEICLQGGLRDDLMPGEWIKDISNDEIWNALESCNTMRDPFFLIGALDIAMYRQEDQRFSDFAQMAVSKLVEKEFLRSDGIDVYDLYPLLSEFVYNHINLLEGCAIAPPFWKRMCAWMHAGFLLYSLRDSKLDLDNFSTWISENMTLSGMYSKVLDFRSEPMYRSSIITRNVLREEIFGRLVELRWRHEKSGRLIPNSNIIDHAMKNFESIRILGMYMPGPMQGHIQLKENVPKKIVEMEIKEILENKFESRVSNLSYLSQIYLLDEGLIERIMTETSKISIQEEEDKLLNMIDVLVEISLIACVHRKVKLSETIVVKIIEAAYFCKSEEPIGKILQALIIASSAYQNEDEWSKWLEAQLAEVALKLHAGDVPKLFLAHLREIKKVIKLDLGIHCRAEAIASLAF